jgi:hypothetical protein
MQILESIKGLENDISKKIGDANKSFNNEIEKYKTAMINFLGSAYIVEKNTGLLGFNFDIVDEIKIEQRAIKTQHTLENGTKVSDHISINPRRLTMTGLVSEVVYKPPFYQKAINKFSNQMGVVSKYVPSLTSGAEQVFAETYEKVQGAIDFASGILNSAKTFYDLLLGLTSLETKIEKQFTILDALINARGVYNIELKVGKLGYQNMAVLDIRKTFKIKENGDKVMFLEIEFEEFVIPVIKTNISESPVGNTAKGRAKQNGEDIKKTENNTPKDTKLQSQSFKTIGRVF